MSITFWRSLKEDHPCLHRNQKPVVFYSSIDRWVQMIAAQCNKRHEQSQKDLLWMKTIFLHCIALSHISLARGSYVIVLFFSSLPSLTFFLSLSLLPDCSDCFAFLSLDCSGCLSFLSFFCYHKCFCKGKIVLTAKRCLDCRLLQPNRGRTKAKDSYLTTWWHAPLARITEWRTNGTLYPRQRPSLCDNQLFRLEPRAKSYSVHWP